jgi:hypothetical protein
MERMGLKLEENPLERMGNSLVTEVKREKPVNKSRSGWQVC